MPLLKRKPFKRNPIPEGIRDDDDVYYCEATKEIFKSYDDFFERVMLTNSVVWTCSLTGRPELTYAEALASEKTARKLLRQFPSALRGPVILVASRTKRSALKELVDDVYNIIKDRFFKDEKLDVLNENGKGWRFCKIVKVIFPSDYDLSESYDLQKIEYRVAAIDDDKEPQEWTTKAENMRRDKTVFTKDKTKLFLKQHIGGSNSMLIMKEESIQKYVTDRGIKAEDIFVGKLPDFELSKKLQQQQEKNSKKRESKGGKEKSSKEKSTNTKKKGGKEEDKKKRDEESKKFREQLEAKKKEKAEMEAEKQRKIAEEKAKLLAKIQAAVREHNQTRDDLELIDQRILPKSKEISTVLDKKYFGDFMKVLEFIHSFPEVLSISDKFPYGLTMDILERALVFKEVNGPLSDILQVLLGTVFSLQMEEENEIEIQYRISGDIPQKHSKIDLMRNASRVQLWMRKHLNTNMNHLIIDSTTVSELLRLHFMSSGALLSEKSSRSRFQSRGGYRSHDDPGLHFVSKYPHIIKFLTQYSVFQLSTRDILRILSCLTDQILTFSNLRDVIEDRIEQAVNARLEYRNLRLNEGRRERKLAEDKKTLQEEHKTAIAEHEKLDEKKKDALIKNAENELEQKIAKLDAISAKEKAQYLKDLKVQISIFFNHQTYLGSDRAFRNYYIFESLPGLFVENDITFAGKCLDKFVKNNPALAHSTKEQRYGIIKQMISTEESNSSDDKENKVEVNGTANQENSNKSIALKKESDLDVQKELLMCNCDPSSCAVHSENVERSVWTYYHTAEEIDALIESLNTRGYRESKLREQLEANRDLIVDYIKNCPLEKLQVNVNVDEDVDMEQEMKKNARMVKAKTNKSKVYDNPNFNCKSGTNPSTIYDGMLRSTILDFEHKLSVGCLGEIKVQDKALWRKYIEEGEYYALDDNLKWGNNSLTNGHAQENGSAHGSEAAEDDEEDDMSSVGDFDLAQTIDSGNCSDADSDGVEAVQLKTSEMESVKLKVKNLAMALLQVEQGIDIKFIRAPFGPAKDPKDKALLAKALALAKKRLLKWEESLMKSTNFSQVFLHYSILQDSIKWSRSAEKIGCLVCRSKSDPEQTLLCDQCNKGWHMFCLKPKLTQIPHGDWFCPRCRPEDYIVKRNRKRPAVVIEESASEEEEEDDEDEDDDDDTQDTADSEAEVCTACGNDGEKLLYCCNEDCSTQVHLDCAKPPAKSVKSKSWKCSKCVNADNRKDRVKRRRMEKDESNDSEKQEDEEEEEESEDDEPPVKIRKIERKRGRKPKQKVFESDDSDNEVLAKTDKRKSTSRRSSARPSRKNSPEVEGSPRGRPRKSKNLATAEETAAERRASKRSLDNFNTISLSTLIDEVIKHKNAWPFTKPVSTSEVPDYLEVIKTPMDFSKIKSKLNLGDYSSNEQAMKDIELVFFNCDLYNISNSEIYKSGAKLEKFVAKRCKELNLPFTPSDMTK
ncbi:bromodomain adjacent to zinc finger domain protein 1A isoform X2 [Chironomus tepperi]|uniref:bromodomain adjacent to zinc finger domain protein 1A isoform X2 n=1 Tax=Chironomus tepperi TaxID=113505 RepID=UPI00391F6FF7